LVLGTNYQQVTHDSVISFILFLIINIIEIIHHHRA